MLPNWLAVALIVAAIIFLIGTPIVAIRIIFGRSNNNKEFKQ